MRSTVQETIATVTGLLERFNALHVPEGTEDNVQECINDIRGGLMKYLEQLTASLPTAAEEEPSPNRHDLANHASVVISNLPWLIEELNLLKPDLQTILAECTVAMNKLEARILAKHHNVDPQILEKWDLPDDLVIIMIDDSHSVLAHMKSFLKTKRPGLKSVNLIRVIGGKPQKYPESEGARTLILLDHNLGTVGSGQLHGADLVEELLATYPGALLIVHTSDAERINADTNNPYAQKHLPVVGKFAIKDIADLMRNKGFVTQA
jgi:hypothetical protein